MSYTHKSEIRAGKRLYVVIREGGGDVPPPCEFETEEAAKARAAELNKELEDWLARTKNVPRMTQQEADNERKYKAGTVVAVFGDEALLHVGRDNHKIGPSLGRKRAQEENSPELEEEYKGPSIF